MAARSLSILVWFMALVLLSCSRSPTVAGGAGGETTNGIIARAIYPDGAPASNAFVRARPSDYVQTDGLPKSAVVSADAVTDSAGQFVLGDLEIGNYAIEVNDQVSSALLIRCTLDATADATIDLGTHFMKPHAVVQGVIVADTTPERYYVQVVGLQRLARVDTAGRFAIADLPEGNYLLRAALASADTTSPWVTNVRIPSGETTSLIIDPRWHSSRRIYLNTTSGGAGITEDVIGFPLLVRLDDMNFDFPTARDSGQDLRFVDANGTALPHAVEFWDPSAGNAAIWVKVDTVHSNSDTRYVTMLWGNPGAPSQSDETTVFDTAEGFAAVWQDVSKSSTGTNLVMRDKTANVFKGLTFGGMDHTAMVGGVAGTGVHLDGVDDRVQVSNFGVGTGDFMMSCWIKSDAVETQGLFSLVSCAGPTGSPCDRMVAQLDTVGRIRYGTYEQLGSDWLTATDSLVVTDGQWHHVTVAFDRDAAARLYLDGVLTGAVDITPTVAIEFAGTIWLGESDWDSANLAGVVDEFRAERICRSDSWIRLCFESQREGSLLLRFE